MSNHRAFHTEYQSVLSPRLVMGANVLAKFGQTWEPAILRRIERDGYIVETERGERFTTAVRPDP